MRRLVVILIFWSPIPFTFLDPYFGVLSYILMNIIRPEQLMWGDRYAAGRIYLFTQIACFLSWFIHRNSPKIQESPTPLQLYFMLGLAIQMSLVTQFASNYSLSDMWTSRFWKTALFCFVLSKSINSVKKLELSYVLSLIWLTLLALWGIQQRFGGNVRMEGLGGDQLFDINDISSLYVMFVPMAYYSLFSSKKWIRLFVGIPSFMVFVIFLLFGGSRGAFLGLAACLALIFLRAPGLQKFKIAATMIIVGVLLGFLLVQIAPEGFFDQYTERLKSTFGKEDEQTGTVEREGSSAGRIAMWKGAWTVFLNNPKYWTVGIGMRCYPEVYSQYFDIIYPALAPEEFARIYGDGRGGKAIHNTQLNVLLSGGLPLILLWMLLIFFSWYQAHNFSKHYPKMIDGVNVHNYAMALEIGIVGWFVCMTFLNLELVDFFYWHLTMTGVVTNLGRAKLKRELLGIDEEDDEMAVSMNRQPAYSR